MENKITDYYSIGLVDRFPMEIVKIIRVYKNKQWQFSIFITQPTNKYGRAIMSESYNRLNSLFDYLKVNQKFIGEFISKYNDVSQDTVKSYMCDETLFKILKSLFQIKKYKLLKYKIIREETYKALEYFITKKKMLLATKLFEEIDRKLLAYELVA